MTNKNRVKKFVNIISNIVDTTPQLASCKADIKTLCSMLTDWAKGDYRHISKRTAIIVGVCIGYVISPIDLIPDFIPVAGKIDDISVILFMLNTVKKELGFYRIWQVTRDNDVIDVE